MKIVVLGGSPNKKGSTHILADCFRQGAEEAGHAVEMIDIAHADIHPCIGCIHCGYEGPCVQKDDVEIIRKKILDAGICHAPLLLWHVCPAEKNDRPVLCLQQLHPEETYEVGITCCGMEQRQLDLRCAGGSLQDVGAVFEF